MPFRIPFPRMDVFYQLAGDTPLHAYVTAYRTPTAGEQNFRKIFPIARTTHPKHGPIFDVFEKVSAIDQSIPKCVHVQTKLPTLPAVKFNSVELIAMYKTWGIHFDGFQQSPFSSIAVYSLIGKVLESLLLFFFIMFFFLLKNNQSVIDIYPHGRQVDLKYRFNTNANVLYSIEYLSIDYVTHCTNFSLMCTLI